MRQLLIAFFLISLITVPAKAEDFSSILAKAEQNYADYQFMLGSMFFYGTIVSKDVDKAKYWFERSGHLGNIEAQRALGSIYLKDIPMNFEKAEFWAQKAAYKNDAYSQFIMFDITFSRRDKPRNSVLAHAWLSLAVEQINNVENVSKRKSILKFHDMHKKMLSESELNEVPNVVNNLKKDIKSNTK